MPIYVSNSLTAMFAEFSAGKVIDVATQGAIYGKIDALMMPFGECERIKQNPARSRYVFAS